MKYSYAPNNLDLLRLILATSVIFLHLKHLSGSAELNSLFGTIDWLSSRAVPAFFIVSGFLIFMSFDKNTNLKSYAMARILRLYPAFLVLIFVCVVVGFINAAGRPYFSVGALKYIFYNSLFLNFMQPTLPYLFSNNEINVVNGALWTLKIEVMFYVLVPFLYFFFKTYNRLLLLSLLFLSSLAYIYLIQIVENGFGISLPPALQNQLPAFMHYFTFGIAMYLYFNFFVKYAYILLVVSFILVYLGIGYIEPVLIGLLILILFIKTKTLISFRKFGDISYGVYIFHFPIIQIIASQIGFDKNPIVMSVLVLVVTFVLSFLSWHLLEKRMIGLKKKK